MQIPGLLLLGFPLLLLVSACSPTPLEPSIALSATPSETATATSTLIPLIRPAPTATSTPSPRADVGQPLKLERLGESHTLTITGAEETNEAFLAGGILRPKAGWKMIVVRYEYSGCSDGIPADPILIDEKGQSYSEGHGPVESGFVAPGTQRIRTTDCRRWFFGVPVDGRHFSLVVPAVDTADNPARYYEISLDDTLYPPPPPLNCRAEALSETEVRITWEAPAGLEGDETFYIMWGWGEGGSDGYYNADQTSALISGLTPDTDYFFRMITRAGGRDSVGDCTATVRTMSR